MFTWLLLLVPLSVALAAVTTPTSLWTFAVATAAVVPLAESIRRATEHLARRAGPAIGGLLNVSFGNTAELVLALFVLASGKPDVVKAQLTGLIIGNSLLGLGLAIVVGSFGRDKQTFKRARAGQLSSLLVLSMIALLLPAVFDYVVSTDASRRGLDERLSLGVSVVLISVYGGKLGVHARHASRRVRVRASRGRRAGRGLGPGSVAALAGARRAGRRHRGDGCRGALHLGRPHVRCIRGGRVGVLLGVILLALVGNAAEYVSAVYFARQDRMGLAISIAVGSTIQIALLVAPLLVLVSAFGGKPMNLVFSSPSS